MMVATSSSYAQDSSYPPSKPSPPKIDSHIVLLHASVVESEWPNTLDIVNAPETVTVLNPGQCVRFGIYATGDRRDGYLGGTKMLLRIQFAGKVDTYPYSDPVAQKKIKPEGLDFVAQALGAGGVKLPERLRTTATLGVVPARWCVPEDARDGSVTVEAEIDNGGRHQSLSPATATIESFETGSKRVFKSETEMGTVLQTYYRHPNPGRLLPALLFAIDAESKAAQKGKLEISAAFFAAAVGAEPVAAKDFQSRLSSQPPMVSALGLLILRAGGVDISGNLNAMSDEERNKFLSLEPLQDPFDLAPTGALFTHLDMLWATFGATGELKPLKAVAGALAWKSDYEDFDKLRKSPNHPSTLTPSIVRGVTYTAAGWSLYSFQRNDPLAADYIQYLLASSEMPQSIKDELSQLSTDPAFKQAGGK